MFPLGMVVFPFQRVALCVFEPRYHRLLEDIDASGRLGTCLISRGSDVGGHDERSSVGTAIEVVATKALGNGKTLVMVEGHQAIDIVEWMNDDPYPRARVRHRPCHSVDVDTTLLRSTVSAVRALRALQSEIHPDQCLEYDFALEPDIRAQIWQLCSLTSMSTLDQFMVLQKADPNERLRLVLEICCERYGDYQRMLLADQQMVD